MSDDDETYLLTGDERRLLWGALDAPQGFLTADQKALLRRLALPQDPELEDLAYEIYAADDEEDEDWYVLLPSDRERYRAMARAARRTLRREDGT